jgi:hypothetical protein
MTANNGNDTKQSIRSLRDLRQDVPPPRDLWPAISAEISKDAQRLTAVSVKSRSNRPFQWLAAAAVIAALAVGVWVGRTLLPMSGTPTQQIASTESTQDMLAAAYVSDPRYLKHRAELMRALDEKMKTLPPETQKKVTDSLATIRNSITDIQAALGRDPGNALLQELLVNSYQDEMRVMTAVNEAGPRQEI